MGSCVMKTHSVAPPKVYHIGVPVPILQYHKINSEYLKAEARKQIFRAKDNNAPKLDLGKNLLYIGRLKHFNEITTDHLHTKK